MSYSKRAREDKESVFFPSASDQSLGNRKWPYLDELLELRIWLWQQFSSQLHTCQFGTQLMWQILSQIDGHINTCQSTQHHFCGSSSCSRSLQDFTTMTHIHTYTHKPMMQRSPTFHILRFFELRRLLGVQVPFGGWRGSRVPFDRGGRGGGRRSSGGQLQIYVAGSRVDRPWCHICGSWSHVDRAGSHGRPGADGGLGDWLLSHTGWLQLRLQREEWQKMTEECNQCWQLIQIQWDYCHVWLNHWIHDLPNNSCYSMLQWNIQNGDRWSRV